LKLYKYTTRDAALKILKHETLQFSFYDALNDPFEFTLQNPPHMAGGESPHYREPLAAGLMLCSFSTVSPFNEAAILLFSHYSEGPRGVVLEFDSEIFSSALIKPASAAKLSKQKIIPGHFYKIKYRKNPIKVNHCSGYQFVKGPLLNKSNSWIYEQEFRVFAQLNSACSYRLNKSYFTRLGRNYIGSDENSAVDGRCCFPFPKESLTWVYFGCQHDVNFSTKAQESIHSLLNNYPHTKYDYLVPSDNRYHLTQVI
jgi:hypothetical protein